MKEVLVDKNQRPIIKNEWVEFPGNEALQEVSITIKRRFFKIIF